jgi:NAD(P)H-hydrate epimerase
VQELLRRIEKPLVIDADALHATNLKVLKTNQYVCTPHKKEFEILLKVSHCKEADFKKLLSEKKVILKKGPVDEIFAGKVILQNKTGCPQMAVAGTGDILAGFVAGLLAQKVSPLQSSITAAYLVGKAGEKVKKKYTNFSASKLLEVF